MILVPMETLLLEILTQNLYSFVQTCNTFFYSSLVATWKGFSAIKTCIAPKCIANALYKAMALKGGQYQLGSHHNLGG